VTGPIWLLAWRSLVDRPRRTLLLLVGYGIGVAVMIALLSVGDALLSQARDRDLVAGGDLVLLPEGVDPAVLKVNGVTDLYFTIQQTGFVVREILRGPRFDRTIAAAAPQIDARQLYVGVRGRVVPAIASAGIPSLDAAAVAAGAVPGARDSARDREWIAPGPGALVDRLDRFHAPPRGAGATWAEWDYFNFVDPATGAYGYLTILVGGEGRGGVLLRIKRPRRPVEDLTLPAVIRSGDLSETSANQRVGPARVQNIGGRYHVTVDDPRAHVDLWLAPMPGSYLPPEESAGDAVISGYVVPAVRGWASGEVRTAEGQLRLAHVPGYHDHNWGTWRGVTWEWGEAGGPAGAILYGVLHVAHAARGAAERPAVVFVWGPARARGAGGFLAAFPVRRIRYSGWHAGPRLAGREVSVPAEVILEASAGADEVAVRIRVRDALASLLGRTGPSATAATRPAPTAAFLQLRGFGTIRGTIDGRSIGFSAEAAAETFVPLPTPEARGTAERP
jgi:hypothetical protein